MSCSFCAEPPKENYFTVDKHNENEWIKQVFSFFFIALTFCTKGDILENSKLLHIATFF